MTAHECALLHGTLRHPRPSRRRAARGRRRGRRRAGRCRGRHANSGRRHDRGSSRNCLAVRQQFPRRLVVRRDSSQSCGRSCSRATGTRSSHWPARARSSRSAKRASICTGKTRRCAVQQDYFDRHIRLSQATGLPLIIHLRETAAEILTMLREAAQRGTAPRRDALVHGHDQSKPRNFSTLACTSASPAW